MKAPVVLMPRCCAQCTTAHICDRLPINQPLAANIEFTLREFKVQ